MEAGFGSGENEEYMKLYKMTVSVPSRVQQLLRVAADAIADA
jgi:hypothetical protein